MLQLHRTYEICLPPSRLMSGVRFDDVDFSSTARHSTFSSREVAEARVVMFLLLLVEDDREGAAAERFLLREDRDNDDETREEEEAESCCAPMHDI